MSSGADSAHGLSPWAAAAIEHVRTRCAGAPLDRGLRITLNFHPDVERDGVLVLEAMADEGAYRSQFETCTSNGGLTAYPGGARWRWEERIFGGAYDGAPPAHRPKYGALNHRRRTVGGAVRFGSAHLRLAEPVLDRSTYCFPDSVLKPTDFGTAERFDLVPRADAFAAAVGDEVTERRTGGVLDDYIEAHVHGPVLVRRDVEALVLDPCHAGSPVEAAAHGLGVRVEWHEGRVLTVEELERHPHFRGPEVVAAGRAIARRGVLDARVIGDHRRTGRIDPQTLKKVWHLVARFGSPAM